MARPKGTGNLQREKNGLWTVRVGICGKRICRSSGTSDRAQAERFLARLLAPLGLGPVRIPLAEAWHRYEMSPNRRDIARTTLKSKRSAEMRFARWMEANHLEVECLAEVTEEAVAEYLAELRCRHSSATYNNHVCILREIFRLLAGRDGADSNPWDGVKLLAGDSVSRRELTLDEVKRLYAAAAEAGPEWRLLVMTGLYTGLRLGDCCRLAWGNVDFGRRTIQVIPEKTKRHMHGRPVTIPIHPQLFAELKAISAAAGAAADYVNPTAAEMYLKHNGEIDDGLRRIFKRANITMSVRMDGRNRRSVLASFHSLRHTFVSLSANAGVPLAVVQSIVGHSSTAMTRHYYHENEAALRRAVESIPAIGAASPESAAAGIHAGRDGSAPPRTAAPAESPARRLKQLARLHAQGLVTDAEYAAVRIRILNEL